MKRRVSLLEDLTVALVIHQLSSLKYRDSAFFCQSFHAWQGFDRSIGACSLTTFPGIGSILLLGIIARFIAVGVFLLIRLGTKGTDLLSLRHFGEGLTKRCKRLGAQGLPPGLLAVNGLLGVLAVYMPPSPGRFHFLSGIRASQSQKFLPHLPGLQSSDHLISGCWAPPDLLGSIFALSSPCFARTRLFDLCCELLSSSQKQSMIVSLQVLCISQCLVEGLKSCCSIPDSQATGNEIQLCGGSIGKTDGCLLQMAAGMSGLV
mmetsp:Transcript_26169/g.62405  ORF Transcript_26169/g.62405 Transcript_26169/m.62405 type:complete len:262 (-) Transcript_26169:286-1071(-)